jgi:hypothetical protein
MYASQWIGLRLLDHRNGIQFKLARVAGILWGIGVLLLTDTIFHKVFRLLHVNVDADHWTLSLLN